MNAQIKLIEIKKGETKLGSNNIESIGHATLTSLVSMASAMIAVQPLKVAT